jgi:hypothetical protein
MKAPMVVWRTSLVLMLGFVPTATADLYVSTDGSDVNDGTAARPLRTIGRAYSLVAPGSAIIVMPGVYTDYTSGWGLRLNRSGTASSPIVLRSSIKSAAVIDGQYAADRNKGIYLQGSYNILDGFQIKCGPSHGIFIEGNFNQILNCEIHHNGNVSGGQGVYSGQNTRDNRYVANYAHDNGLPGSNLDHGLYLCGDNEWVINNILSHNSSYGLHLAGYTTVSSMKVYNNVMAFNGKGGIMLWLSLSGVDIKNNIISQNGQYGINSYDAHGSGVVVDHNLLFGNATGEYSFTGGGSDYSYMLGTTIRGDPMFVNIAAANFDPHLQAGSASINAGLNLSSVFTTDKDGATRSAVGAWDLGPYVYGTADSSVPQITSQPVTQTVAAGQVASFSVTASGATPLGYQWQKDGTKIPGATAASYTTPATVLSDNGSSFRCVVSNGAGSQTSTEAALTVLNPSTRFVIGDQVTPNATVNVRSTPAGALLGTQPAGAIGTVTGGPVFAVLNGQNVWWWNVNFVLGVSGWVGEDNLNTYTNGSVLPPLMTSLSFEAELGQIAFPFVISVGGIFQATNTTNPWFGGAARYRFNIVQPGDYVIRAIVNAPNGDADSLFVNIDGEPTDPTMIWDTGFTVGLQERVVSWRGTGTFDAPEFSPKRFALSAGEHTLIIRGREANTIIDRISIETTAPRPSAPQGLRVVDVAPSSLLDPLIP